MKPEKEAAEWLRNLARNYADGVAGMLPEDHRAWEIADEIERLSAHVEALQDKIKLEDCACSFDDADDVCIIHSPTVEKQRVEIERLRAALQEIHDFPYVEIAADPTIQVLRLMARRALEQK